MIAFRAATLRRKAPFLMRIALLCLALVASNLAAASNYREVTKAVGNDQLLQSAGVAPTDARLRRYGRRDG